MVRATGRRLGLVAAAVLVALSAGTPVRAVEPGEDAEATVAARFSVSPLLLRLELDATSATVGRDVKARIRVSNASSATVREVEVAVRVEASAFVVRGGRATIGQIPAGRTATVGLTLCGRLPGTYLVLAQATLDGVTIESPAAILTILPGTGRRC